MKGGNMVVVNELHGNKLKRTNELAGEMMKCAVLSAPKNYEIIEIPIQIPGDNQVLVKLQGCGICNSNIPVWQGRPWFTYPLTNGAPGHEGWGIVESIGKGVNRVAVGDRVTFLSGNAFSQYEIVNESNVIKLPHEFDTIPFPGEPLGCAVNIFARSNIRPGDTVAVIGVGFIGALLIALAVDAGANVIAISKRKFALSIAKKMGASFVLELDKKEDIIRVVNEITENNMCDSVIEATGFQQPLELASMLVKTRGRLVIAGYHQDGNRSINVQLWNWKGIDVINAHERNEEVYIDGINKAIELVRNRVIKIEDLITHTFTLETLSTAFEYMIDRPEGFLKALVVM
jgi:threonine dehydrogenase-like Zn-dependent dehydrogenase